MKFNKWCLGLLTVFSLALMPVTGRAQTNATLPASQIESLLGNGFLKVGEPLNINGTSYLATTNASGGYTFTITKGESSLSFTPPTTAQGALDQAQTWINENNPTNITFYGTNDIEISLEAAYMQDSGSALIGLTAGKYGLIKPFPQIGVEAELFQGTLNGKQSTAGAVANLTYRKPIGDVAVTAALGAGYDNWSQKLVIDAKAEVEYRLNPHLSSFVDVRYNYEGIKAANDASSIGGLGIGGGVRYSF